MTALASCSPRAKICRCAAASSSMMRRWAHRRDRDDHRWPPPTDPYERVYPPWPSADDTSKQIVKLPMGAESTVAEDDGKGFWIAVNWTGRVFQILTVEFRNRCEPVHALTED